MLWLYWIIIVFPITHEPRNQGRDRHSLHGRGGFYACAGHRIHEGDCRAGCHADRRHPRARLGAIHRGGRRAYRKGIERGRLTGGLDALQFAKGSAGGSWRGFSDGSHDLEDKQRGALENGEAMLCCALLLAGRIRRNT